jgi:DNA polymerase III alpha subunit
MGRSGSLNERPRAALHLDEQVHNLQIRCTTMGTFQIESRAQMNMLPRPPSAP